MIKNQIGEKVSPKEKGKEIIKNYMQDILESDRWRGATIDNTDKEKERIKEQMNKIYMRILRLVSNKETQEERTQLLNSLADDPADEERDKKAVKVTKGE